MEELENVFEERAEFLSAEDLLRWTRLTSREQVILRKLMGSGAKLLVGPRGCGKSTLMKVAYFNLLKSRQSFPVYVNYSKSLALEPMFHSRSDAIPVFRKWLYAKIVLGLAETYKTLALDIPQGLASIRVVADKYTRAAESGVPGDLPSTTASEKLTTTGLADLIEDAAQKSHKLRVILLLDDAAHAFSSEQQREFFEVFRDLRSRYCAPKAAIYPGITSFSPNFHVGHEAEVLEAWYGVDDPGYLDSMRSIVERRLPASMQEALSDKADVVDYLALASFGLPRAFINMLSSVVEDMEEKSGAKVRGAAPKAVEASISNTNKVFTTLSSKLPKFKNYVVAGSKVRGRLIDAVRAYNALPASANRKTAVVAIEEPIPNNLERILHMLEYAGLVREIASLSKGEKGTFRRYQIHYGLLIAENALSLGKSVSLRAVNSALIEKGAHAFVRVRTSTILPAQDAASCTMNLLPCQKCGVERQYPDQRFCMNCGAELQNSSVYLDLLNTTVDELPLPKAKIDGIRKHTTIRTVQNILMDDEAQELRDIPWVGPVWSKRIRTVAEEFVGV